MCSQVFTDEKTNETPAVKDLLKIIDIKDTVVTWDVLNTHKFTIKSVICNKDSYVCDLKGNHGNLFNDVKDYFDNLYYITKKLSAFVYTFILKPFANNNENSIINFTNSSNFL